MKKYLSRITLAMVIAMLLVCVTPVMASAKTVKMNGSKFTTSTAAAEKKAKAVKRGAVTVQVPKSGYLKFTAPAAKTYAFTVSNIKSSRYNCGYFYVMTKYGKNDQYIGQEKLVTKGGKSSGMYVSTRSDRRGKQLYRFLKSRTGKIALKKGQTVYVYLSMNRKCTLKLTIK